MLLGDVARFEDLGDCCWAPTGSLKGLVEAELTSLIFEGPPTSQLVSARIGLCELYGQRLSVQFAVGNALYLPLFSWNSDVGDLVRELQQHRIYVAREYILW